jgi:hypothetical protein
MNKLAILIAAFLMTINTSQACNKAVDPKKTMLFVDVNASYPEVKAAKEAACSRGETFVVLPGGEKYSQDLFNYVGKLDEIEKTYEEKCNTDASQKTSTCTNLVNQYNSKRDEYNKRKSQVPLVSKSTLDKAIKGFAQNNSAITSAVFSGHDGGGTIGGETGQINKYDFMQSMNDAYAKKPALKAQLESVFMAGCYTSTPSEVLQWKTNLPSIKIMGGFHGVGPSNKTLAAQTVLKDFLIKSKLMCETCNEKKLKTLIASIGNINYTAAGIYVKTQCNNDEFYYYNSKSSNGGLKNNFSRLENAVGCNDQSAIRTLRADFHRYDVGELTIPKDITGTPLRSLYASVRQIAQCLDADDPMNANRVGMILFYHGVAGNFNKLFGSSMKKGQDVLSSKADAALKSAREKYMGTTQSLGDWWNDREYLSDVMNDFDKHLQKAKKSIGSNGISDIHKMDRAKLIKTLSDLDPVINHKLHTRISDVKSELAPLIKAKKEIETYLYKLDHRCMDFLDWHEVKDGHKPVARCQY